VIGSGPTRRSAGKPRPGRRRGGASVDDDLVDRLLNEAAAHYAAGRLEEAQDFYRRAEAHDPGDIRAPYSLAVIDIKTGRLQSARGRLRAVARRDPAHFHAQHNLGAVCQSLELWSEAALAYRRALTLDPDASETAFNLARCLTILGRIDEAIGRYRALARQPANRARALTRMAILEPAAVDDTQLAQARLDAVDPRADAETRAGLQFALGAVLEARGADDEAFGAFAAGNRLKRDALIRAAGGAKGPGSPCAVAREHAHAVDVVKNRFTPEAMAALRPATSASAAPIFIVGMPRSGSTLVEQILSSHGAVQGMGESPALSSVLDDAAVYAPGAPMPPARPRSLAEAYLSAMRARGWKARQRFVDKTLENHLHVGMIDLMFPKAIILNAVRDPIDTCLACFRQLFATGGETLYDLGEIGAEYVRYARMMEHWRTVAPGRVIDVSLEALVASPDDQIRWLVVQACGLDWDSACLRFHETARPVRSASAAQVRRPVFTSSIGRWRRYGKHLGPLLDALGPLAR
jgi:thioredoxin-like negative regulator of GroEL